MRIFVFVGVCLGVILTIVGAYLYDTSTGRAANGLASTAANGRAPLVNWDVVSDNWQDVKIHLKDVAADVERGWRRVAG
jgi:hypothetical protein